MTRRAERNQVANLVRVPVVVKQPKGLDVVNGKAGGNNPTMLASVLIALAGGKALLAPVWPTTARVPAKPRRIIGAQPAISGCTPYGKAFAVTEVVLMHRRGLFLNVFAAGGALHHHTLSANAKPVRSLPFSIARRAAEMTLGLGRHVRFGYVGIATLLAG
jgi:hypothetical protein